MRDLIARLEGFRRFMLRSADRWPDAGAYNDQLELIESAICTLMDADAQRVRAMADPR